MTDPPYPHGRLKSRIVIGPEGTVRGSCAVESELNAAIDRCILDDLLTMKFPESINQGWIVVDYPWVLEPSADGIADIRKRSKRPAERGKK